MKSFMKVLIWLVVLGAVCAGVYVVLPEYPQSCVKSAFQPHIDPQAKVRIDQVQALTNRDLNSATYKTILEGKVKNPCWVYEFDETTGAEKVTFYGRGILINLKDWKDYDGKLSTSASVKMEFEIAGNKVEIHPYVDGKLMEINDGKHDEQNDDLRLDLLSQLYNGMKVDN